jgi:hypothetical protein
MRVLLHAAFKLVKHFLEEFLAAKRLKRRKQGTINRRKLRETKLRGQSYQSSVFSKQFPVNRRKPTAENAKYAEEERLASSRADDQSAGIRPQAGRA